jgi:hypothetical protein
VPLSKNVHRSGGISEAPMANLYNIDLDRNPANYQPLTPLTFLERAASWSSPLKVVHQLG